MVLSRLYTGAFPKETLVNALSSICISGVSYWLPSINAAIVSLPLADMCRIQLNKNTVILTN